MLRLRGKIQAGTAIMTARVAQRKTKRIPSTHKKPPIPAAKLARRLAEVQALRKLVQQAEASRAC
jgi:hypothetical protein